MHSNRTVAGTWPAADHNDPYESIYLRRDRWWGLIDEQWLSPAGGQPITWDTFASNVNKAKSFHSALAGKFHPNSFVYYGADDEQKSFERVKWMMKPGFAPDEHGPAAEAVMGMSDGELRDAGLNPAYVGGRLEVMPSYGPAMPTTYEASYWELHCELQDGVGDGTVPVSSGSAPMRFGAQNIKQQFPLTGFSHEGSYRNPTAQLVTLYAITKIAGKAKIAQ